VIARNNRFAEQARRYWAAQRTPMQSYCDRNIATVS
jgi:hypothetical protein